MFKPIKVVDIELSQPITTVMGLAGYNALKALVRLHGTPLGYVQLPVTNGCCSATTLGQAILDQHSWAIIRHLVSDGLARPGQQRELRLADLVNLSHPVYEGSFPLVTVAVCTRNRTADLAMCLEALNKLDYPNLDILIVDNAPSDDATERLVQTYPPMRYVCEPRPGLDWARNRAIIEAKGEIIAYTDDDVIVDPGWVRALAQAFVENPEVMAITGLIVPYEIETEAQFIFEWYGGFGRGFERKWHRAAPDLGKDAVTHYGWAGQLGTGANMAYRRELFDQIGYFDPALDVGTVTNGGGDIEMFFRVLQEGCTLVYEPCALVYHRHRRDYEKLHVQIMNNGVGFSAYFVRSALTYPKERLTFIRRWLWWFLWWGLRRVWHSLKGTESFPRELILAEIQGGLIGLGRYQQARRTAARIAREFGPVIEPIMN